MRWIAAVTILSFGACHTSTNRERARDDNELPPPTAEAVRELPVGARLVSAVSPGLPDDGDWDVMRHWWQAALQQSPALTFQADPNPALPAVTLTVDPEGCTLTATLTEPDAQTLLHTTKYGEDSETRGLLAALDRLAWATRRALGEATDRPMPVAAITSADPFVVRAVEDAADLIADGAFAAAYETLRRARRRDGGAPYVLAPLAAFELMREDAARARAITREAIGYPARCSPTVQHRLARTLLLASAALNPADAPRHDRELQRLATVTSRERPHDDEVAYTAALSHNYLGEFDKARPLLERLRRRQPSRSALSYHLGWACLGTGDPAAAADHLRAASLRMPLPWVLLPWTIALFEAKRSGELTELLRRAAEESDRDPTMKHQILRMQAADAVLRGEIGEARNRLLANLQWLIAHPRLLNRRVGEFAEAATVLVRLGSHDELPRLAASIQTVQVDAATRDAAAYVGGLHQVRRTGRRSPTLEAALDRDGDSAWGAMLAAYAHEMEGEVAAMQSQLARAAMLSSSPLTKSMLAMSLRSVGKSAEADRLLHSLRREMLSVRLRSRCQHPIYGPELAYAFALR